MLQFVIIFVKYVLFPHGKCVSLLVVFPRDIIDREIVF